MLAVDDEWHIVDLVVMVLEGRGTEVRGCLNGVAVLKDLEEFRPMWWCWISRFRCSPGSRFVGGYGRRATSSRKGNFEE